MRQGHLACVPLFSANWLILFSIVFFISFIILMSLILFLKYKKGELLFN